MFLVENGVPIHVSLSEAVSDPRQKPAVPGRSVRLQGCLHDFDSLVEVYGSEFVAKLLDAFTRKYVLANPKVTEKRTGNLRRFLRYLAGIGIEPANNGTPAARVFRALCEGGTIEKQDMIDAVEVFCAALRDTKDFSIVRTTNLLTRKPIIENLSTTLQDLAAEGVWPHVGPLKGTRVGKISGGNIPPLGELVRSTEPPVDPTKVTYSTIMERNRERLLRLRELMVDVLVVEEAKFDRGRQLLDRGDLPELATVRHAVERLTKHYGDPRRVGAYMPEVAECFPLDDREKQLASLLRYLSDEYGGVFLLRELPDGLQRVVARCGGIAEVRSMLEGGRRALVAAYMLVLIDTGLNVQSCDDLAAEPFIGSAERGLRRLRKVGSVKNRQRYEPVDGNIIEDIRETPSDDPDNRLPDENSVPIVTKGSSVSGARAIEIWQRLSEPLRRHGQSTVAQYLWIYRDDRSARRVGAATWKGWWRSVLDEIKGDPVIGGLHIQRRMIRTTIEQLREASHGGDAQLVSLLSGRANSKALLGHYWNRAYMRKRLDELIREFIKLLEAQLGGRGDGRAALLGITDDELERRLASAAENGLGFLCEDPTAGIQPGVAEGELCTTLENCAACPLLRFVPTPQALRDLVLFKRSLEAAEDEFVARNPERWAKVWMVGQALAIAALSLVSNGPKKRLIAEAEAEVDRGLADGSLVPFKPW